MIITPITQAFLDNPRLLDTNYASNPKLAKRFGVEIEEVLLRKTQAKYILEMKTFEDFTVKVEEESKSTLKSESVDSEGNTQVEFVSDKPLTKLEIEELYGVDNISSRLTNYWNKQQSNGKYLTSAFIKCLISDFYTVDELTAKLKELFPKVDPISIPYVRPTSEKALFIYISDDHCGLILKDSLYGKEYSGLTYIERLLKIIEEVKHLNEIFEDVYVINLGDEMDGYNSKTTRYDHSLDSMSNKQQFDTYVTARTVFYYELFKSKIGQTYRVVNLNNSNHTGLGFSYMATKAVDIYIQSKFPEVEVSHISQFICTASYGNHIINLTHGKDEKYMKSGMPLNLDLKTDLWLMEYTQTYIKNNPDEELNSNYWVSTIKGDLHKYNLNVGKSGRYVNVPSISSGSNWIEHNFGDSRPGILLEIVTADSPNIISLPIWF